MLGAATTCEHWVTVRGYGWNYACGLWCDLMFPAILHYRWYHPMPARLPWRWLFRTRSRRVALVVMLAGALALGGWRGWVWYHSPIVELVVLGHSSKNPAYVQVTPDCWHFVADIGIDGPDSPYRPYHDGQADAVPGVEESCTLYLAPDGHWTVVTHHGSPLTRWLDGRAVAAYSSVWLPNLHEESRGWMIASRAEGGDELLYDAFPGPVFPHICWNAVESSPDGQHVAYIGERGHDWVVVRDHQEVLVLKDLRPTPEPEFNPYNEVLPIELSFSDDSQHLFVRLEQGKEADQTARETLWCDQKKVGSAARISPICASHDGRTVAYEAWSSQEWKTATRTLVLAGRGQAATDYRSGACFIPGSNRLAYIGMEPDKDPATSYLVVDGRRVPDTSGCTAFYYSADGQHLAWQQTVDGQHLLVVDGQRVALTEVPSRFCFAPTGGHWACVQQVGGRASLVVDGRHWSATFDAKYDFDSMFRFSPDGAHVWLLVAQDEAVGWAPTTWDAWIDPLRDVLERVGLWSLWCDWEQHTECCASLWLDDRELCRSRRMGFYRYWRCAAPADCSAIGGMAMDHTGRHWACFVAPSGSPARLLYDGVAGPAFERIWCVAAVPSARHDGDIGTANFAADGSVTYLAYRDHTFYRVTHRPRH